MSVPIELWRTTPVVGNDDAANDVFDRRAIFPSARQAINATIARFGLGRGDWVAMPGYSSHCVIDFLSRRATPVPADHVLDPRVKAALLYDQWGWQRPAESRLEFCNALPRLRVIWDRVDSLFPGLPPVEPLPDQVTQLFSLSKTLGIGGGGLIWDRGWVEYAGGEDRQFVEALHSWSATSALDQAQQTMVDQWFRNECRAWPPKLRRWLERHSVARACGVEAAARRERLMILAAEFGESLPAWMRASLSDRAWPAPGIFPIPAAAADHSLLLELAARFGIRAAFYHFDYSPRYFAPEWQPVLALPLHSDVSGEALRDVSSLLRARRLQKT